MNKRKEIILLGDLNINMLSDENDIKNNLMDVYDLSNLIIDPTCFKRPGGGFNKSTNNKLKQAEQTKEVWAKHFITSRYHTLILIIHK